jgi:hypothetical protein
MMVLWLLAGALIGTMNGMTRWWTVSRLGHGVRLRPRTIIWGGLVLRFALVAAVLILGLRRGIIPGLLAFAGLWLARWGSVIWLSTLRTSQGQRLTASSDG